ncbi:Hsp70 family protein [Actinoplanes sp. NPDC023714]|uniref:Hsp70 family protein n=1 Tax=Actinoplanes sp. NPDC023714 TaxID=3154322 RepID=UPI0033DAC823
MYALGLDLGTTYTAAATWRDGHAEIVPLGSRSAVVPSVVLLRADETFLTGEAASRRGLTEPHRVAREFKRRMGDTTPILLGGVPQSAEALAARMLHAAAGQVYDREGGVPAATCVSYPANWGPYKIDLMRQAVRMAGLGGPVAYTTEPEAVAAGYARQQRLETGAVVAVYDLGGGTFDAAVLRKTAAGFDILGRPEGIERLGGIDFDAAVFHHVQQALGGRLADLDEDDSSVIAAVGRLREECVTAKEALSSDTDTTIPVLLPGFATEVRLTRSEFEAMVRPALYGSVEALKRAVASAGCGVDDLHAILLAGGSSRMPIVAQMVAAEFGRPVAVDAHPKHAVALGAAWLASGAQPAPVGPVSGRATPAQRRPAPGPRRPGSSPPSSPPSSSPPLSPSSTPSPSPSPSSASASVSPSSASARAAVAGSAPVGDRRTTVFPASATPPEPVTSKVGQMPAARPPERPSQSPPAERAARSSQAEPTERLPSDARRASAGARQGSADSRRASAGAGRASAKVRRASGGRAPSRRRWVPAGAAIALVVGLVAAGLAYAGSRRDDPAGQLTGAGAGASAAPGTNAAAPADEVCTDRIRSNPRWVCLTSAVIADGTLTIDYDVDFGGSDPDVSGGYHLHIYGGDGTYPADHDMGSHAPKSERGDWYVEDARPSVLDTGSDRFRTAIGDAPKVCARIALAGHGLVQDTGGTYRTGNCVPIVRE